MSKKLAKPVTAAACERCRYFQNDPAALEQTFRGLTAMSSGHASVRARDGLCSRHDLYLSAHDRCPSFVSTAAHVLP